MKRVLIVLLLSVATAMQAAPLKPVVELEEEVYSYTNANNGAGPLWCHGSTCLVRMGDRLFASGLETVPDAMPLNNCRWMLFERRKTGWERVWLDADGRTREPAPLAGFADGRLFLSANPTLGTGPEPNGGPAKPVIFQFQSNNPSTPPLPLPPRWQGEPPFREHSYRSFAADGLAGELILFNNIDYTHAEWSFLDRKGAWSTQGRLKWPMGISHDKPGPVRVCYPNVALLNRAVHFCGVSDIIEPNKEWREYKRQLTGREWDYDFRRLFYTWTPDTTRQPFAEWIEIASREKTCGWVSPGDLYAAPSGDVHIIWSERALDERLRAKFFPAERQTNSLRYALLRGGKILRRLVLSESTEDQGGIAGSAGRFHVMPDGRLLVVYHASGNGVSENRVLELLPDGTAGTPVALGLAHPFTQYYTATPRAGSAPSRTFDMLGQQAGTGTKMTYARIRF